jgi:hypothetical protein
MSFLKRTYLWLLLLPIALIFTGAFLNQVVLIANGDHFPVLANGTVLSQRADSMALDGNYVMIDDVHCVMSAKTHLNFLADIWDLGHDYYSIGDGLLILGEWLLGILPWIWGAAVVRRLSE